MIVVFISARAYEQDFRKFLLEALHAEGHEAWHVKVGRRNVLTGADEIESFDGIKGLLRLIHRLRAVVGRNEAVYVDTTGAIMPIRSLLFRMMLRAGTWCFDVYDNLVYNSRGLRRLKSRLAIWTLARVSDVTIVLSAESLRLFPSAFHLDNAWDIPRRETECNANCDLVVLSTIDERFDFEFLTEVARLSPERRIFIHGYALHSEPAILQRIAEVCARYPNVHFKGRYGFDDVPSIVRPFGIGLTPYKAGSPMTEFINPDKYYLFLQAGLEVISTDIPQARRMAGRVHVAGSPGEAVEIARRIDADPASRKNAGVAAEFSWKRRAREFVEILRAARRTQTRQSRSSVQAPPAQRSAQPERRCP